MDDLRDMIAQLREANETTRLMLDEMVEALRSVNDQHLRQIEELASQIEEGVSSRLPPAAVAR